MLVVGKSWKTLVQGTAIVAMVSATLVAVAQGTKARTTTQDSGSANISRGIQTVRSEVHHDVSLPLRDLILAKQHESRPLQTSEMDEAEPVRSIPLPQGLKPENEPDTALQTTSFTAPSQFAPTTGFAFEGLGNSSLGFAVHAAPPDTNGAVGLTQYVQILNTSFAVFDKSNGAIIGGPAPVNALFTGFGGVCETTNQGDPVAAYDKLANRWVLTQFAFDVDMNGNPIAPFLQCIAVSTTADAMASYNRYSFTYSNFDDYPKMGVWPDAYYFTFNMFGVSSFVGADVCAYDRNAMLNGQAAQQVCFQQGSSVFSLLPSDADGTTPPPIGSPNYMVSFGTNNLQLFKFHVDFANTANSTFTGPTTISVSPFSPLCGGGRNCVPQPNTAQKLDSLADRLMYRLAYRNFGDHESLVVNHSVAVNSNGGVRWYELQNPNGAVTVAQQSTFAPDVNFRWMGSIAMDKAGDMAMGYSLGGSSLSPSIAVTGRAASDPANTMQAETVTVTGSGSQTNPNRALSRWGDYSAMQVDPSDDCTFWFVTEYMKTTGIFNWNTRVASFKFPNCVSAPLADYSLSAGSPNLILLQGGMATSNISVSNPVNGFNGSVTFTASGLPSGVTAGFSPTSSGTGTTLTLTASGPVSTGIFTVTVTGTSGNLNHVAKINVATGLGFVPVTPCRVVDTRNPTGQGGPFVQGGFTRVISVPGITCNIPSTAQAFSLNVTVVPHGSLGFLTMAPCGEPLPLSSTLNSIDGRIKAGAAIVPTGPGGAVCAFPSNDTDIVLDINGYFISPTVNSSALAFFPLAPCRVVDTRNAAGSLGGPSLVANASRTFPVLSSSCNIPGTAQAYSMNFTSVPQPGGLGFLTTWPAGQSQPLVSTLNAPTGAVTANAAIVPAGTNGDISVFVTNTSDLVIDINGYFAPAAPGGLSLYSLNPCRVLDTRNPPGSPPFSGKIDVNVLTSGCGASATAQAFVLNGTVVPPGSLGFLTLWPQGQTQPLVSTLNAGDGAITSNLAIVPTTNGSISAFGANPTHLVLDISGFFAP